MKPNRYTVLVIPDPEGSSKRFSFSRKWFLSVLAFSVLILVGLITTTIYMAPRVIDYQKMESKYNELVQDQIQVMELYRDLERLKQMEEVVQRSLGAYLVEQENPEDALTDSFSEEPRFHISYIENIPSVMPVSGYLTQTMIRHTGSWLKNHYGIDIATVEGEPIAAAAGGQVVFSGWTPDLGNLVVIYHGDDYFTYYGHNQLNLVDRHQYVQRGEIIANTGNTGMSSGPHLHFEVWKEGEPVNPLIFFPEYSETNVSVENNG